MRSKIRKVSRGSAFRMQRSAGFLAGVKVGSVWLPYVVSLPPSISTVEMSRYDFICTNILGPCQVYFLTNTITNASSRMRIWERKITSAGASVSKVQSYSRLTASKQLCSPARVTCDAALERSSRPLNSITCQCAACATFFASFKWAEPPFYLAVWRTGFVNIATAFR